MVIIFGNNNLVKTGRYLFGREVRETRTPAEPRQRSSSMIKQVEIAAEEMLYGEPCFDGSKINL